MRTQNNQREPQKERELEKKRESNLISGTHVVKALERLAEVRPDIFGGDELEAEKKVIIFTLAFV
jgi:hypothetical protein